MKYTNLIFRLVLSCLLTAVLSIHLKGQSYWEAVQSPPGGRPDFVESTADGRLYAVFADNSIFRSVDNGQNWLEVAFDKSPFDQISPYVFTIGRAGTWFVENHSNFLNVISYKSNDEGQTWQVLADSARLTSPVETSTGAWFAVNEDFQVLRSLDSGATWTLTSTYKAYHLQVDAFDHIIGFYGSSVSVSYDGGDSWIYHSSVALNPSKEKFLVTQTGSIFSWQNGQIYRINYGPNQNGSTVLDVPYIAWSSIFAATNGDLYFTCKPSTGTSIIYVSTDDGNTWTLGDPSAQDVFQSYLTQPLSDGSWLATDSYQIVRSTDHGKTWQISSSGINKGEVIDLSFLTDQKWFALTHAGFWKTTDGGQSWERKKTKTVPQFALYNKEILFWGPQHHIILNTNDSLFLSTDEGQTYQNITPFHANVFGSTYYHLWLSKANTIFTNGAGGLERSADEGLTWQLVVPSYPISVSKVKSHPSGALFAAFDSSGSLPNGTFTSFRNLYKSTDDGLHWSLVFNQMIKDFIILTGGEIVAVADNPTSIVLLSTDLGLTWTTKTHAPTLSALESGPGNWIFAYGKLDSLFFSPNAGTDWLQTPGLPLSNGFQYTISNLGFDPQNRMIAIALNYPYINGQMFRTTQPVTDVMHISGTITKDGDGDCQTADPSGPLASWLVKANGADTWIATTDSTGKYNLLVPPGSYQIHAVSPFNLYWETCGGDIPVQGAAGDSYTADINIKKLVDCPYMFVDLMVPLLHICGTNYAYVGYDNKGTVAADSAYVDIDLGSSMVVNNADLPFDSLGNNTYRFHLGTVQAGQHGGFSFSMTGPCDSAQINQTVCMTAHIHPDSVCIPIPGWSGAQLAVAAQCKQDTAVLFQITNLTDETTQSLQYVVVEDDVVLKHGFHVYQPHEVYTMEYAANGHTWYLQTQQEPNHPFSHIVSASIEGCNGLVSTGLMNMFNLDNGIPSQDVECVQIGAPFDPNEKKGFPLGYGAEHFIEPKTPIEYQIGFQNVGTDYANRVVLRDTLDPWLEPTSIKMGASSFPYTWKLDGHGYLTITFSGINLPDSNQNEAASHGYVSFRIEQKPGVPLGTVIHNQASIYFDFNAPVQTNQTFHRIGQNFIKEITLTSSPDQKHMQVRVIPNPVVEEAQLELDGLPDGAYNFRLMDASGRELQQQSFSGHSTTFQRNGLPASLYFFQVTNSEGGIVATGKMLIQ